MNRVLSSPVYVPCRFAVGIANVCRNFANRQDATRGRNSLPDVEEEHLKSRFKRRTDQDTGQGHLSLDQGKTLGEGAAFEALAEVAKVTRPRGGRSVAHDQKVYIRRASQAPVHDQNYKAIQNVLYPCQVPFMNPGSNTRPAHARDASKQPPQNARTMPSKCILLPYPTRAST